MKPLARVIVVLGWLAGAALTLLIPSVLAGCAVWTAAIGLAFAVALHGERTWARLKGTARGVRVRWQLRKTGSTVERA